MFSEPEEVVEGQNNTRLLSPFNFDSELCSSLNPTHDQDTSIISTEEAMSNEYIQATDNIPRQNRLHWVLPAAQTRRDQKLFENLQTTPGHSLRLIPRLALNGNSVIDTGGVFRDTINRVFRSIYESDIFESTNVGAPKSFRELSPIEFEYHKAKYFVLGKIFYWFVIIHRQVPYPMDINPAIVVYAIHGKIPRSILQQIDASVNILIQEIAGYNSEATANDITENVKDWLRIIGVPLEDFTNDLQNLSKGASYLADNIATLAVVNNSLQAFDHFRDGFNDQRGFETV